jgi:Kef-type K+ transport system membrane component KefB
MPLADPLSQVLLALAAVLAAGLILGRLVRYLGQPPVIGEVIAGVLLGPSLLGSHRSGLLLPATAAPLMGIVAQLGILLYMFTVGLALSSGSARQQPKTLIATALASLLVPFGLGIVLALALYPRLAGQGVALVPFALFIGVSLCVTAFPVLARILADRKMLQTPLGSLALSCAALGDVAAWCLLAFVVGVATSRPGAGLLVGVYTLGYLLVMALLVRPLVRRVVARWEGESLSPERLALIFVALLLSALATERIGIHAIFGAFLLGALIPQGSVVARTLAPQLQPVVTTLLLPAFFALTGMRTRLDLISGAGAWLTCGAIILVATLGKVGGTFLAARGTGLGGRDALILGTLMNTRGLMELIVLNIGLELKVLSPALFAMLVVMALATTMMTAPALQWLLPVARKTEPWQRPD